MFLLEIGDIKTHVLTAIVMVQSLQIIQKTSKERDYMLVFSPLAPSDQSNKAHHGVSMQPGYPPLWGLFVGVPLPC